jgi:predicted site-specific integrase-resolvase
MCLLLGVVKRTLARYCQKKLIRYYTINGRVWYKANEVEEFLKKKGKL